jgi:hypothetical protein
MNSSLVILLIALGVATLAFKAILRAALELAAFERGLKRLPNDGFPSGLVFQGSYESCRLATEFLGLCSRAVEKEMIGAVSVDRASAPLISYFRTLVNTPRSWAGVLILCGLLVTLLNLQGSVGTLGASFQSLSTTQTELSQRAAADSVRQIQTAMGDIASRAHDAFLQSFRVIALATLLLALTLVIANRAQRVSRTFATWANSAHLRALVNRPPVQETQVEKLNELISKLADVATGFESLSPAMTSVGDLGAKLDASSQIVAEAVQKLPDTINASVGQLSVEVTRDISAHLNHQIEHLKKILAIYGDQELRVKKIQEYLDKTGDAMEAALKSLRNLSSLPGKIDALTDAVQKFGGSAATVASSCAVLDAKIEHMPVLDVARIDQIATLVSGISAEVREFTKNSPELISGAVNAKLDRLSNVTQTLAGRDPTSAIAKLREDIGELRSTLIGFESQKMESLAAHVEKLLQEKRPGRFPFFGRQ